MPPEVVSDGSEGARSEYATPPRSAEVSPGGSAEVEPSKGQTQGESTINGTTGFTRDAKAPSEGSLRGNAEDQPSKGQDEETTGPRSKDESRHGETNGTKRPGSEAEPRVINNANEIFTRSFVPSPKALPNGTNGTHQVLSSPAKPARTSEKPILETSTGLKDQKDIELINSVLANASPEAHQQILRDNWRTFLFPTKTLPVNLDKDPLIFTLRAGLKHARPEVVERLLKTPDFFGRQEVVNVATSSKLLRSKVISTITSTDILTRVNSATLDAVVGHRLKDLEAQAIVNMLARGRRLGYKLSDIVDESENVIPAPEDEDEDVEMMDQASAPAPVPVPVFRGYDGLPSNSLAQPDTDPLLAEQERNAAALRNAPAPVPAVKEKRTYKSRQPKPSFAAPVPPTAPLSMPDGPLVCPHCQRTCPTATGWLHHTAKEVCRKEVPKGVKFECPNCFANFTGKQGIAYHQMKGVCTEGVPQTEPVTEIGATPLLVSSRSAQPLPSQDAQPQQPSGSQSRAIVEIPSPARVKASVQTPQSHKNSPLNRTQDSESNERSHFSPSELPPHKLAEMNRLLDEEEVKYQKKRENAIQDNVAFPTAEAKEKRLTSLKASNATSRSVIRRKFGVTMRMRDKEKKKLAESSPAMHPEIEAFRRTSTNGPQTSSPTTGFSPINASKGKGPAVTAPHTSYQPGVDPVTGRPWSYAPNAYHPAPTAYTSSPYSPTPWSGAPQPAHNALKRSDLGPHEPLAKRQRMTPPAPAPGAQMVEVASEDAATQIARMNSKKVNVGQAQAKWNALQPGAAVDRGPAVAPPRRESGAGEAVIMISSSSSEDEEGIPATLPLKGKNGEMSPDQPLPSVEGMKSATASPRGSMMAKRGGFKGR